MRSSWEANWARYLNWLVKVRQIAKWEYEPKTFEFPIKRGSKFYTPDFLITNIDGSIEWHEVKGWMDPRSATKLRRFGKYFPGEKIIVIEGATYHDVAKKIGKSLPHWEVRPKRATTTQVRSGVAAQWVALALGLDA